MRTRTKKPATAPAQSGLTMDTPLEELPLTGTHCSDCGEPQRTSLSGVTCSNGHGGAPSYEETRGSRGGDPADVPLEEKVAHVKASGQTRAHTCHWPGCVREVPPASWGCQQHWFKLPKAIRDRIWKAYAPGQEATMSPSAEYIAAANAANAWILDHLDAQKFANTPRLPAVEHTTAHERKKPEPGGELFDRVMEPGKLDPATQRYAEASARTTSAKRKRALRRVSKAPVLEPQPERRMRNRLWTEDDATPGTPGHVTLDAAWLRMFGEKLDTIDAVMVADYGDETEYIMPNGAIVCSSYAGNSCIDEFVDNPVQWKAAASIPTGGNRATYPSGNPMHDGEGVLLNDGEHSDDCALGLGGITCDCRVGYDEGSLTKTPELAPDPDAVSPAEVASAIDEVKRAAARVPPPARKYGGEKGDAVVRFVPVSTRALIELESLAAFESFLRVTALDGAIVKVAPTLTASEREAFDAVGIRARLFEHGASAVLMSPRIVADGVVTKAAKQAASIAATPEDAVREWFAGQVGLDDGEREEAIDIALEIVGAS